MEDGTTGADGVAAFIRQWAEDQVKPLGWQPIGTAPRDGTRVLLWCADEFFMHAGFEPRSANIGSWWSSETQPEWPFWSLRRKRGIPDGWAGTVDRKDGEDNDDIWPVWMSPTHWMPLPPPPGA
jgi:hypothetical protein